MYEHADRPKERDAGQPATDTHSLGDLIAEARERIPVSTKPNEAPTAYSCGDPVAAPSLIAQLSPRIDADTEELGSAQSDVASLIRHQRILRRQGQR